MPHQLAARVSHLISWSTAPPPRARNFGDTPAQLNRMLSVNVVARFSSQALLPAHGHGRGLRGILRCVSHSYTSTHFFSHYLPPRLR